MICGGGGFIGSFCTLFKKKCHPEHEITIVDGIEYSATQKIYTTTIFLLIKNILKITDIEPLMPEFDLIINFAAQSRIDNSFKKPTKIFRH